MKFKKFLCLCLISVMVITLASCGVSREEFVSAAEEYAVFDEPNFICEDEIETVADFIELMESFDGENDNFITFIHASWSMEELNEKDDFITELQENTDFVYDDDKYYGELYVNIEVASKKDYSTREDVTYHYLFSLKDDVITLEASATSYGDDYDYENFIVGYGARDAMTACALLTIMLQDTYK